MKLFQRRFNYVGSWHFYDTEDISSDSSEFYYSDFYNDLLLLLTLLEKHQLLTPKFIGMGNQEPLEIVATKVEDIVKEIKQHGDLGELYLYGNTIIFTELGQEKYDYLCSVDMRFHEKNIVFRTKSDIWLPITVDEDYTYTWNLEHYQLNYHRLETALNDIKTTFKWKENSDKEYEHESGCIHLGYKFFLSERIITREYNENPKSGFSLEEYLQQISDARESQADEFYGNKGFDSHEELMNPYRPSIQIENKIINFLFNEGTNIWQTKTIIDNNEIEIEINFKFHNQKEVDWEHFKNFFNFIDQADRLNDSCYAGLACELIIANSS